MMNQTHNEDEEMTKKTSTTVGIAGKRKDRLNDAVVKLVMARKESVTISEIVHYLIDSYLDEAVRDLISEARLKEKNS